MVVKKFFFCSQIAVIPLNSSIKEWNLTVPTGEEIVCIACSSNLICLATSAYFVRVFTTYGIQKGVFAISGPIVAMSAQNSNLLIAYHAAAPRNKDQCMEIILVTLEGDFCLFFCCILVVYFFCRNDNQ